jgi:hypothetical protein
MTGDDRHERMIALAKSLLKGTNEGKISWTTTDDEKTFLYSRPGSSATVSSSVDSDGDNRTVLSVHDSRGTVVQSIQNEFRGDAKGGYEPGVWNGLLDALFAAARRSASDADDALDEILDDLMADLDDPIGGPAAPPQQGPSSEGFPGPPGG